MVLRQYWLLVLGLCLGCHSLASLEVESEAPPSAAKVLWDKGQEAMSQGRAEEAIRLYEQCLASDGAFTCTYLSLAAAYLECGQDAAACEHMGRYLEYHPEHLSVRVYHAELLMKLKRLHEARPEFERFIEGTQPKKETLSQIVHCHGRLVEIAEAEEDDYQEHLNRGIGLLFLAELRSGIAEPDGELPADGLVWKAVVELKQAHELRRREARPCWYLYSAWRRLAQQQPAQRWLRTAQEMAPFSTLTPAEQCGLHMARCSLEKL